MLFWWSLLAASTAVASENSLSLEGLPRFEDSPARLPATGFGFRFETIPAVGQRQYEIAGELGTGYRLGFITAYTALDSIYARSYTEVDYGQPIRDFVLGGAYGFSLEWIPGGDLWTRHRYKVGVSYGMAAWHVGGMISGYFDDFSTPEFLVGGVVVAANRLDFYFQWDGSTLDLGSLVRFRFADVEVSYRFPGFGVSLSIIVHGGSWGAFGTYRFSNESMDFFRGGVSQKQKKKTIL